MAEKSGSISHYAGIAFGGQEGASLLEITGQQISSARDCLRAQDWQVYKLSIAENGKRAVTVLASKTGGDASHISAPLEMHGSEADDLQQHLKGCSTKASLDFQCSVLSVSSFQARP